MALSNGTKSDYVLIRGIYNNEVITVKVGSHPLNIGSYVYTKYNGEWGYHHKIESIRCSLLGLHLLIDLNLCLVVKAKPMQKSLK